MNFQEVYPQFPGSGIPNMPLQMDSLANTNSRTPCSQTWDDGNDGNDDVVICCFKLAGGVTCWTKAPSIWKVTDKIVFLIHFKIQFTWFWCGPKKMSVDRKIWVCWVWVWVWTVECGLLTMTVPYLGNPPICYHYTTIYTTIYRQKYLSERRL